MVPSSLEQIFGTLSVGIFAAAILILAGWIGSGSRDGLITWIRDHLISTKPDNAVIVTLFLMLYGFGIVVENITDHLTDSERDNPGNPIAAFQINILKSEGHHRFKTLFKNCDYDSLEKNRDKKKRQWKDLKDLNNCRLSGLGKEIFLTSKDFVARNATSKMMNEITREGAQFFINAFDKSLSREDFIKARQEGEDFVNILYYEAKNWAYAQKNHYEELDSIQRHIEYTRSSFLIATYGIAILFISFIISLFFRESECFFRLKRLSIILATLLIISWISLRGYDHTENNFNERAFGYFASHMDRLKAPYLGGQVKDLSTLTSIQWVQKSAEYAALTRQVFNNGLDRIEHIKGDCPGKNQSGIPCAIVMDIDETVIDNSKFSVYRMINDLQFSPNLWQSWEKYGATQATLVPGAEDFIKKVESFGITVVYISNRSEKERAATITTLKLLKLNTKGIGETEKDKYPRLLLKKEELNKDKPKKEASIKMKRRQKVIENYRKVLAYFGDNLGDFDEAFDLNKNKDNLTIESRKKLVDKFKEKWGTEWFVLPNPIYGTWDRLMNKSKPLKQLDSWVR